MRTRALLVLAAALPLSAGCGAPRFVEVTGRVTHKGRPVPNTLVKFVPDNGERPCGGVTDDAGTFHLRYSRTQSGAPPGPYTVFLTYVPSNEEENHQAPPKANKELKEVIARYGDVRTSGLHFEVTKDGQPVAIELQ
jgi:hypothetical protein